MASMTMRISTDSSDLQTFLRALLEELANVPAEFRQRVLCRLDALLQAGCVHVETLPATAAGQVRIALQPSDSFRIFAAAVRAGKFDAL